MGVFLGFQPNTCQKIYRIGLIAHPNVPVHILIFGDWDEPLYVCFLMKWVLVPCGYVRYQVTATINKI